MTPRGGAHPQSGTEALRPGDGRLLEQYLSHLRVERGLADNTVSAYRRDLVRYLTHLGTRRIDPRAVTPADLGDWLQAVRTGEDGGAQLSAASAARALASVRGFHSFLDAEQASHSGDPSRALPAPARSQRLPHPLSISQVEALIAAAGRPGTGTLATERALRDHALLELLYGLGARISEVIGLDVDDIDPRVRSARLHGKGDRQRVVPVGRFALEALEAYLTRGRPALAARGRGTPAILLGSRGTRLTRQAAWQVVRRSAEAAELTDLPEPISPHTLRHSFATHLLLGGADVRSVQELLGHASVTTTQLYTQVTVDSLREAHAGSHPRARRGA